ncbi:MAG: hypothetical protein ACI9BW_001027 [Gammaproteobacteria bacterium]|jgi:hypothetical protein
MTDGALIQDSTETKGYFEDPYSDNPLIPHFALKEHQQDISQ